MLLSVNLTRTATCSGEREISALPSKMSVDVSGWEFDTEGHISNVKSTPKGAVTNVTVNIFKKTHKVRECYCLST